MFSSNDRSRWAMVHALVDHGTFAIGVREERTGETPPYKDTGNEIIFNRDTGKWKSLDIVLRPDTNEFLSSKPPLLSVLVAGLYWVLKTLFGWTLVTHPFLVVRTILLIVNLLPFAIYLILIDRWLNRYAVHEWTRLVVLAAAAFGTIVTPFLITLNNHTSSPPSRSPMFAVDAVLAIHHAAPGPTAGCRVPSTALPPFSVSGHGVSPRSLPPNEMPALSPSPSASSRFWASRPTGRICGLLGVARSAGRPRWWRRRYYFGTNYAEMGQLRPAYAEFGQASGGWYDYPGSYWKQPQAPGRSATGIDFARMHETWADVRVQRPRRPSRLFFADADLAPRGRRHVRLAAATVAKRRGLTLPWFDCVPFGDGGDHGRRHRLLPVYKSDNYSGWSNGLRWLMWLTPLLLLTMIPSVDRLADSSARTAWFVYVLLAASIFAAHYSLWNPWRQPWIYVT